MEKYPTAILDSSKLPLPKDDMKTVFKLAWLLNQDKEQRAILEVGYLHLSNFQDGIGDIPIDCTLPSAPDPAAVASTLGKYLPVVTASTKEMEALAVEFDEFKRRERPQSS